MTISLFVLMTFCNQCYPTENFAVHIIVKMHLLMNKCIWFERCNRKIERTRSRINFKISTHMALQIISKYSSYTSTIHVPPPKSSDAVAAVTWFRTTLSKILAISLHPLRATSITLSRWSIWNLWDISSNTISPVLGRAA